jgi:trehalose 6-phosphate phosphatase
VRGQRLEGQENQYHLFIPDNEGSTMPSDLENLEIELSSHGFFFDLDGTLAPITDDPSAVTISEGMRQSLSTLINLTNGAVVVLTGRGLNDAAKILGPLDLPVVGSHGLEYDHRFDGPDGDPKSSGQLRQALSFLETFAAEARLKLEHKPGSIAIHYRHAPEQGEIARQTVENVANQVPGLRAIHGKMVSEIAIASVNKGTALAYLMHRPEFADRIPIMIGDDVTDEDGFEAAQRLGGSGIKIGAGPTQAMYRAQTIGSFHQWLTHLLAKGK